MWSYTPERAFLALLTHDADLYQSIEKAFAAEEVQMGFFFAIGAVKNARISFYDQHQKTYLPLFIDRPAEILSCMGNMSLLDGKPFVHVHITLGFEDGSTAGGHLMEGTIIYACELHAMVLKGKALERHFDSTTGLKLWRD